MSAPLKRHRLSVTDYHAMAEHGILAHDARVELIDGEIIDMTPIGISHASIVSFLNGRLARATDEDIVISPQNPVRLSDFSEPQPDLTVLRPRADGYRDAHATPADSLLVIEVAQSSLRYDRDIKLPLYARHGIGVVWLVDVAASSLTVHAAPGAAGYASAEIATDLSSLPLGLLHTVRVDLTGLFG